MRGPTAASRGEILATPGRADPVVHSLTGSSRLSFALSLWPQRLFCTAVLLFYCSTVLLLLRVQLSSNTDPLSVAVTCGCAGAQVVPSLLGQDQVQTHLSRHIYNLVNQREKNVIEGGFNSPLF